MVIKEISLENYYNEIIHDLDNSFTHWQEKVPNFSLPKILIDDN